MPDNENSLQTPPLQRPPAARARALLLALALGGMSAPASAQAPAGADPKRQALEQKLKLVENMMNSPRVRQAASGDNAEAKAQVAKAAQLVEAAKTSLAGNDLDQAGPALDQALKSLSSASRPAGQDSVNLNLSAQRTRHAELTEQIRTYRASLVDARKNPASASAAGSTIEKVDRATADADRLVGGGKYEEANKILGEAYMAAVTALSSLSAGQTVTLSLKFDTPADEYAYEQKRNHSYELMVDLSIREGRAEGAKRPLVDRFVEENRKLRVQAESEAKSGDYASAIKTMEKATQQLVRALQSVGVPVF